jgi:hypothetical protein
VLQQTLPAVQLQKSNWNGRQRTGNLHVPAKITPTASALDATLRRGFQPWPSSLEQHTSGRVSKTSCCS